MPKFFASKFPDLEKGVFMQAGDPTIRNTFQSIVPFTGDSREAWFFRVSQKTGIRKSRVKSLFYNRQCRLWGDELARISGAIQSQHQPDYSGLLDRLEDLQNRQEALRDEIKQAIGYGHQDIQGANLSRA